MHRTDMHVKNKSKYNYKYYARDQIYVPKLFWVVRNDRGTHEDMTQTNFSRQYQKVA